MTASPKTEPVPGAAPEPLLVHDYLLVLRGAERTFAAMADVLARASPIYTLLYDERGTRAALRRPSRSRPRALQRLGVRQRGFRKLLPLLPAAVERLPVGDQRRRRLELAAPSPTASRRPPDAVHVCYCHTPFRYAWYERGLALAEVAAAAAAGSAAIARGDPPLGSQGAPRRVDALRRELPASPQQRIAELLRAATSDDRAPAGRRRALRRSGEPEDDAPHRVPSWCRHKRVDTALEAARTAPDAACGSSASGPIASGSQQYRRRRDVPRPHRGRRARRASTRARSRADRAQRRGVRDRRGRGAGVRPPGPRARRRRRTPRPSWPG